MAQHKSAAKRARQAVKKNAVNTARKSKVRTSEKTLATAIKKADKKEMPALLSAYTSQMMKAAQKRRFQQSNCCS